MRRRPPAIEALESLAGRTDGQLLDRFRAGGSPLAFEALVARHGPMVLAACRGALGDRHAAEDAFQVVFLTLARRAGSIRDRDSVASWLLGVARRVAARSRRAEARRLALERRRGLEGGGMTPPPRGPGPLDDPGLGPRVLDELARLPERQRAAVTLCYLEGHTCEDAARILGWPVGTVKSRLSRARDRLRGRLDPPGLAALIPAPPVPPRLAEATARLASAGPPFPASTTLLASAPGATMPPILAPWKWPALALAASLGLLIPLATPGPMPRAPKPQGPQPPSKAAPEVAPPRVPRDLEVRAGAGSVLLFKLNERGERITVADGKPLARGPYQEEARDLRWVVVVATLDHKAARAAEALDRKLDPADPAAKPRYVRVNLERQRQGPAGDWSEWAPPDVQRNYQVLDNMVEGAYEPVPEPLRDIILADPLPFLKVGTWEGVFPTSLVEPEPIGAGVASKRALRFKVAVKPVPPNRVEPDPEQPILMIRSIDFTVEADATYRYRARVVVRDPEEEVLPGRQPIGELHWPWSGPSAGVKVR